MKKLLGLALLAVIFYSLPLMAAEPKKDAPASVTPAAAVSTPAPLTAKPSDNIFKGAVSKINFNLKALYIKDSITTDYRTEIGISTRQTLFDNFLADVYIRLIKTMSNDSSGVDLEIVRGSFQYVGPYFQLLAGRMETTKLKKEISTLDVRKGVRPRSAT